MSDYTFLLNESDKKYYCEIHKEINRGRTGVLTDGTYTSKHVCFLCLFNFSLTLPKVLEVFEEDSFCETHEFHEFEEENYRICMKCNHKEYITCKHDFDNSWVYMTNPPKYKCKKCHATKTLDQINEQT